MSEWRKIDPAAPPKGECLLYFPARPNDRYGHGEQSAWRQIGRYNDYPYRPPTHYAPLPPDPIEAVSAALNEPIPWPEEEGK